MITDKHLIIAETGFFIIALIALVLIAIWGGEGMTREEASGTRKKFEKTQKKLEKNSKKLEKDFGELISEVLEDDNTRLHFLFHHKATSTM